jgi:hypothetical protein
MSYTAGDLKADVAAYAKRDISTLWPGILKRTNARIGRDLRDGTLEAQIGLDPLPAPLYILILGTGDTIQIRGGNATLPEDFAGVRQVYYNGTSGYRTLSVLGPSSLNSMTTESTAVGYSIFGDQLQIQGGIDAGSAVILEYYRKPTLANDSDTDASLDAHPQLWLMAALMDLAVFSEDTATDQAWSARYAEELERVNTQHRVARMATSGLVMAGNTGAPVWL